MCTQEERTALWECIDLLRASIGLLNAEDRDKTQAGEAIKLYLFKVIEISQPYYDGSE